MNHSKPVNNMNPNLMYVLVIILPLIGSTFSLLAQQITFKTVDPPHNTFSGFIGGMAQDRSGYIWIASRNGLYRYDGYNYKRYVPITPSDSRMETIYIDREGIIWIAAWINGLYRFDPITETFTHFRNDPNDSLSLSNDLVRSILEDREGTLWMGTQAGLASFDRNTGKFHTYKHDPNDEFSISSNQVRKIYEDSQGTLWIGTGSIWGGEGGETDDGGLNRFDKETGKFIRYLHDPGNPKSLLNNKVNAIFEDSRGVFWVGTKGDGLHTMNRATGEFERHQYDPLHPEKLSRSKSVEPPGNPDHITFITEDAMKQIWVGTMRNGLSRYDPETQITTHYGSLETASGLDDRSTWSFCNSEDGILWIGTFQGTLYRVDPFHKDLSHTPVDDRVISFGEDLLNNLWIGTDQGIIVKNRNTGTSKKFVHDSLNPNSLSNNIVTTIYRDQSGTMWIGTRNGLNRFNSKTNSFTHYKDGPKNPDNLNAMKVIKSIADCGRDSLWIGTSNGLDLMDKRTGIFTHFQHHAEDSNSIGSNNISVLVPEKSGNIWVGTWSFGGLNYWERKTGKITRFLENNYIVSLLVDSEGTFWVGTDDGLFSSKNPTGGFTKLSDTDIPGAAAPVNCILEDNQKNIWVQTDGGILRINLQTGQSKRYEADYGVNVGSLSWGFSNNCFKGELGEIYIGDSQGYYVISPSELTTNPKPPEIAITDFKIEGTSVLPGAGSPLSGPLESLESILLHHDQNTFTFNFAGIHYSNPEYNRHLYMLDNYDPDWRIAGSDKTAYYVNLSPGHYTFKMKAASSEGVWAERSVKITILPPWWKTWWAYGCYGLFALSGIFLFDRYQRRRIIQKERQRTMERELAQAKKIEKAYSELKIAQTQLIQSEKLASLGELTAGIAHEIQNPLNFVNNFAEVSAELIGEMKEEMQQGNTEDAVDIATGLEQNLAKIRHHGLRASSIIKSMLQHSRASTGEKEPTDLNALVDECVRLSYHGMRAQDRAFQAEYQLELAENLPAASVVPQDIGRVLLNLLNNAFFAVNEKRKTEPVGTYHPLVQVSTHQSDGGVEIRIRDNGPGIPEAIREKVFQPFFTTKPTGQGTGLGLSLSYEIVTKGHGGTLETASREGEGTTFTIHLPGPPVP